MNVYWDSCVFIDGLRKTPGRFERITELEGQAKGGYLFIYTSTLAIAEVAKLKEYGDLSDDELRAVAGYFRHKFVKVIPVDRVIARNAAQIVRQHSIKPPDAIHIATALRIPCSVLYTYDGDGKNSGLLSKNGQIGAAPGLSIKRPGDLSKPNLFAQP